MYDYTIHAFFNSSQIVGVLNAVVMLLGSSGTAGDYLSLVRVAALLGLFTAVTYGFVRARGEEAGMYLVMVALFYSTLLVPRVTVNVQEHGGGLTVGGSVTPVANVPIGLAFFASTTSKIGYWLTDQTETFFSLPDTTLRLSSSGLMGGSRILREAAGATIADPILAQDVISFMRDCINPEILNSPLALQSLVESNDIISSFSSLGLVNPGRVVILAGFATPLSCSDAYSQIQTMMGTESTNWITKLGKILGPQLSNTDAATYATAMLPAADSLIISSAATAANALKQRMMINALNDTSKTLGQILNDPAAVQAAYGEAQATQTTNATYRIMATIAKDALPVIRNALELVLYGVFPIILVIIIVAGTQGGKVLKSYVMMLLWCQLWAPLYAILNYIGTLQSARSVKAALGGVDAVSISNASALMNAAISSEAITGLLSISVPMIALALIKGGETAATGVVSSLTSPGNSAAGQAGSQVGTGNISAGNVSWGNYNANNASANHSDTRPSYTSSPGYQTSTPYGSRTYDGAGQVSSSTTGGFTSAASFKTSADSGLSNGVRNVESGGSKLGSDATLTNGVGGGLNTTVSGGTSNKIASALTRAFGKDEAGAHLRSAGYGNYAGWDAGNYNSVDTSRSSTEAVSAGANAGARVQKSLQSPPSGKPNNSVQQGDPAAIESKGNESREAAGFSVGASMAIDEKVAGQAVQGGGAKLATSGGRKSDYDKRVSRAVRSMESIIGNIQDGGEKTAARQMVGNLLKAIDSRYSTNYAASYGYSVEASQSDTSSVGKTLSVDQNPGLQRAFYAHVGNHDRAQQLMAEGAPEFVSFANNYSANTKTPTHDANGHEVTAPKDRSPNAAYEKAAHETREHAEDNNHVATSGANGYVSVAASAAPVHITGSADTTPASEAKASVDSDVRSEMTRQMAETQRTSGAQSAARIYMSGRTLGELGWNSSVLGAAASAVGLDSKQYSSNPTPVMARMFEQGANPASRHYDPRVASIVNTQLGDPNSSTPPVLSKDDKETLKTYLEARFDRLKKN